MKRYLMLAVAAVTLVLGACAKETNLPNPTGKGSIRMLNAIPESPEFTCLIEERFLGSASYKAITPGINYDDFSYTFNFETVLAGDLLRTRVASLDLDIQADVDYTMVVTGDFAAPDVTVWEAPQREWSGTETVFEARAAHHATTLGQVDIYIADEATPPAPGGQFATLGIGEISPAADLEAGDYVVTITPAGDESTILFVSAPVTVAAQGQYNFSIFDADGNDLSPYSVRLFNFSNGSTGAIIDTRFPPQIRFIHGSLNFGDADIYIEDLEENPAATPLVSNHVFSDVTQYYDVEADTLPITYTAPGNSGMPLLETDETIFQGTRSDLVLFRNQADTDVTVRQVKDRRSVATTALFSVLNTAGGRDSIDFYIVPAGETLEDFFPLLPGFPTGANAARLPIIPDSYDIYITENEDLTVLAGPILWEASPGEVVESIIFENVDPNIVDFEFIPLP